MAFIKTLKDFLTKNTIYPTTKTNAVYDDEVGRLDTFLHSTLGVEEVDDVEEETAELRDADTLGGRYTAEDLDAMPHSTAIEDYANVEPPINDADRLGGKYTKEDIEALIEENKKLNNNLTYENKTYSILKGTDNGSHNRANKYETNLQLAIFFPANSLVAWDSSQVIATVSNAPKKSASYSTVLFNTATGEYVPCQIIIHENGNVYLYITGAINVAYGLWVNFLYENK